MYKLILNIGQQCQTNDRYHFDELVYVPHVKLNWILIYAKKKKMGAAKDTTVLFGIQHVRSHVAGKFHIEH